MSERNAARSELNAGSSIVLRLSLGMRVAESAVWVIVATSGVFVAFLPSVFAVVSGVSLLVLGGTVAVRAARARIVLSQDVMTVYGYLFTRRALRQQVKSLERFPTIDIVRAGKPSSQITCAIFSGKTQTRFRSEVLRARLIISDWAADL